jgi:hypothetical protein
VDHRRRLGLASRRWLATELGMRDVGAAGCVHLVAGAFTRGVQIHLGPRIGRFNADGSANDLRPYNLPMTMLGLMLIFVGIAPVRSTSGRARPGSSRGARRASACGSSS